MARQKVATYELQRGSNHLTENFNLCQTEQCGSQFSVNSHRFTNVDNTYSPTKFQTLEKSDHKIHNNSFSNHDPNLYSPFVKYDTNTNSTTGSVHQIGFCTKEMTSINTDIQHSKPIYNYNIPITASSLQFPRKFQAIHNNNNKTENHSSDKWISLIHVQHSAPASPNDYFSQRYKTIDQYQMNRNMLNQKYEILQPHQCSIDEYNNRISISPNFASGLMKLNNMELSNSCVTKNFCLDDKSLLYITPKGILKGCTTELNENSQRTNDNNKNNEESNDVDVDIEKNINGINNHSLYCCNLDKQQQTIQMNEYIHKQNDTTHNIDINEQLTIKANKSVPDSINKSNQLSEIFLNQNDEHNQQLPLINKSHIEQNLLNRNTKYSSSNPTVTSTSSHVSTFI